MLKRNALLSLSLSALLAPALLGCPQHSGAPVSTSGRAPSKKGGPVIARYGDTTLTADELTAKLNEQSPFMRGRLNNLDAKKDFVKQLVQFELLAQEAQRRGLDQDPDAIRAMQNVMVRKLLQQEIDDNPKSKQFSDDELKAYYQAHLDQFVRPESVHLYALFLSAPDAAAAKKRMPEAEKLLKEMKEKSSDLSAVRALITDHSDDPRSKHSGGDLQFLNKEQLTQQYGAEVAEAAFALSGPGALSDVVTTPKGLYVLKSMSRLPAQNTTFDQARVQLSQRVWFDKRIKLQEAFFEELRKKANFNIDESALGAYQVPGAPQGPNMADLNNAPPSPSSVLVQPAGGVGVHPATPVPASGVSK